MICLCSLSKKWNYQKTMSINPQLMHIATILTNTRSIIKKSMHIATDFLSVGFSSPKTFNFRCMPPPPPVILRGAEWRSRRIHPPKNNPFIPGEEGRSQMVGEGRGRSLSNTPHPPWRASSSPGRRFFFTKCGSGFCNFGQALRAEWHEWGLKRQRIPLVFLHHAESWAQFKTLNHEHTSIYQ